jgi:hypothetical protein
MAVLRCCALQPPTLAARLLGFLADMSFLLGVENTS